MNISTSVNNFLPFSINNVERMRVDTTGNVGILRSDPAYPLDISGTARISNVGNVDGSLLLGSAGLSYTNATNNISLGKTTANTTVGSGNVAVGNSTLSSLTTGTNNVALGYIAGNTITSGSQNVYVGGNTVPSAASATNEITVGFGATGLGSNTVVLGNSSITTTALRGNVGIGTTAPTAVLDVNGAAKIRGALDMTNQNITNANQISATTNLVLQPNGGNICIGRTTSSSESMFDLSNSTGVRTRYNTSDTSLTIGVWPTTNHSGEAFMWNESGAISFGSNNSERMRITSAGNVGIGTSAPASLLDVNGTTTITTSTASPLTINAGNQNSYPGLVIKGGGPGSSLASGFYLQNTGTNGNTYRFYSDENGHFNINKSTSLTGITLTSDGYVGIGTSAPAYTLDVSGTVKIRGELDMNSKKITNILNPTNNNDVASKSYVDTLISSLQTQINNKVGYLDYLNISNEGWQDNVTYMRADQRDGNLFMSASDSIPNVAFFWKRFRFHKL